MQHGSHAAGLIVLTLLVSWAGADLVHVPGDFASLQRAVDVVPPGTTIVVHGGTWGPLTISQPLRIVGNPPPLLVGGGEPYEFESPITLAGPGVGTVVLASVRIGATIPLTFCAGAPGISGGGFDALHIHDSAIRGPDVTYPCGFVPGSPAIAADLPFLLLERCTAEASQSVLFDCAEQGPDGVAAISTTGTVVLLDSAVGGGSVPDFCSQLPECGGICPPGGEGGPGLVCQELFRAGSEVTGGSGAKWTDFSGLFVCCEKPDGPAILAGSDVVLPDELSGSGPMVLGSTYTLEWTSAGPTAFLVAAFGPMPPLFVPTHGYVLLDLATVIPLGSLPTPGSFTFQLPANPRWTGVELGFQLVDDTTGMTRPVFGALLP